MESNVLGTRLRTARDKAGFTQVQAAQRLGVGDTALSNYERGERDPDTAMLAQIAALYGVTTDHLLGRTDDRQSRYVEADDHLLGRTDDRESRYFGTDDRLESRAAPPDKGPRNRRPGGTAMRRLPQACHDVR